MSWKIRHEGSPQARAGLTLPQVVEGLRDGHWEPTDEVMGPQDRAWVHIEDHPQLAEVAADLEPPPPRHEEETHIDMNALIDVCLVLLIFFMLTTTYAVMVQKMVPLPTAAEEAKGKGVRKINIEQVKKQMVRVNAEVDAKGKTVLRVDNEPVQVLKADGSINITVLRDRIAEKMKGPPSKEEMLLDARGVSWGTVIAIQDAARAANITRVRYPK